MTAAPTIEQRVLAYGRTLDAAIARRTEPSAAAAGDDSPVTRATQAGTNVAVGNALIPVGRSDDAGARNPDSSRRRRLALALAAASIIVVGIVGLTLVHRNRVEPPRAADHATERPQSPAEPAVYPIVGDRPGPRDSGSVSLISPANPERVMALIAIRDGDSLRGGLTVIARAASPAELENTQGPVGTEPAEAVGQQRFDIHGRSATVWTEPGDARVQHVRFDGSPLLELAGPDALAFAQAAGPSALAVAASPDAAAGSSFSLLIGELPAGYAVVVEPFKAPTNALEASIGVGSTESAEGGFVGVSLANPLPNAAAYGTLAAVDINGISGWIRDSPGNYVHWEPVPGTFATAGGFDTPDEALELARRVRFVDRTAWQDFYSVPDQRFFSEPGL